MSSRKQTYALTVKCKKCEFQVTREVEVEPEKLTEMKNELIKQTALIHKKHSSEKNFVVY